VTAAKKRTDKAKAKKLTRWSLVRIETEETEADLEAKLRKTKKVGNIHFASLEHLRIADKVFQWRMSDNNLITSEDHVYGLAKILESSEKPFEPILVMPIGKHLYVVDGHHRVDAYHSVGWKRRIPVEVFRGSLKEARIEALRRNSKDKLPMHKRDKMEATWKLVKDGELTVERLSDVTGTSPRQIYYMRKVWKWLCDLPKERKTVLRRGIDELSWNNARQTYDGVEIDRDIEDWKEERIQKLVKDLQKSKIGPRMIKYPDIAAEALARLHNNLPSTLVPQWYGPDELRAMAEDIEAPEDL
jgi:hypothetical protein